MTGVVLAGGKSRRLGRDKAFEVIGRSSLVERAVRLLSPLHEVIIVTSRQGVSSLNTEKLGARVVADIYTDRGPLGGIHSGLKAISTDYALVVACDMPFLNWDLLRYEIGLRQGFDAVVPRLSGLPDALHSVYGRGCLPAIERQMAEAKPKVTILLEAVRVRYMEQEEVERYDPRHLSFFNVNSPSDVERARELMEELYEQSPGWRSTP